MAHLGFHMGQLDHMTRPNLAKPHLHLQPACWVLVGHASGDTGPTGPGTSTPLGALFYTGGGGGDVWDQLIGMVALWDSWPLLVSSRG